MTLNFFLNILIVNTTYNVNILIKIIFKNQESVIHELKAKCNQGYNSDSLNEWVTKWKRIERKHLYIETFFVTQRNRSFEWMKKKGESLEGQKIVQNSGYFLRIYKLHIFPCKF